MADEEVQMVDPTHRQSCEPAARKGPMHLSAALASTLSAVELYGGLPTITEWAVMCRTLKSKQCIPLQHCCCAVPFRAVDGCSGSVTANQE